MRYIPVTCEQREAMLRAVGVSTVDELFAAIPEKVHLDNGLKLPAGMSELELVEHLRALAASNRPATALVSLAGAGSYDHHIPSVVDHVLRRPEFFTAYTPYQPEVSQGTLQAIFEYQSMICGLTGMDVANASMYDGATAMVEAALMACRVTKRDTVVCAPTVHPEWRATLGTYADVGAMRVAEVSAIDPGTGTSVLTGAGDSIAARLATGDVAAVVVQSPNFFGNLEDLARIADLAHEAGALFVVAANPILLGVMEPPSSFGADIVVGEGQPLGSAMSFGGPGLGFFTCGERHVRQMPGRLVGRTTDLDGNDAYVLTLSTREQHIRREKATSNICSNHALNALAAGAYLSAVGERGLAAIARACVDKAHYLRERLIESGRFAATWEAPFGYEFALRYDGDVDVMRSAMLEHGFLAGIDVAGLRAVWPAGFATEGLVLFAVTERRSRAQLDAFVEEVSSL
jgi:glycine dehydrogenase subunit 1